MLTTCCGGGEGEEKWGAEDLVEQLHVAAAALQRSGEVDLAIHLIRWSFQFFKELL